MKNGQAIPREIINPVELCARDFWMEFRNRYAQNPKGFPKLWLPKWDARPEASKIICMSRISAWAAAGKPDPLIEQDEWWKLKHHNGWSYGKKYNEAARKHPMAKPLGECPAWWIRFNELFCDMVSKWLPALKIYNQDFV